MLEYTGQKCPVCGQPFVAGDDVVVCPDCGAPYHRVCYEKSGRCLFEHRHSSGFAWQPEPTQPSDEKICPACGMSNAANASFCNQCGTPLAQQEDSGSAHAYSYGATGTAAQPGAAYQQDASYMGFEIKINDTIDEIPVRNWLTFLGKSAPYYLVQFKRMDLGRRNWSFSLSALILGPIYYLYRKMWKWGILLLVANLLLEVPFLLLLLQQSGVAALAGLSVNALSVLSNVASALSWIVQLGSALVAIYLYRTQSIARIRAAQQACSSDDDLQQTLAQEGGTSLKGVVLAMLVLFIFNMFIVKLSYPTLLSLYGY